MLLDPTESQVNSIHILTFCILKGHFNTVLNLCQVLPRIFFHTSFLTICWTHFCYFPCILNADLCQPSWFNQFSNILLKHANYRVPHYVVFSSFYFRYTRLNFVQHPSPQNPAKASNLKTCISTLRTGVLTSLWPHVEPNYFNNFRYLEICGMQPHDWSTCIFGVCLSPEDTETNIL
jgi:hypothetical protein